MSDYEKRSSPIRKLMNHPDMEVQAKALSDAVEGMHKVTPNIAQSLQIAGSRALGFLNDQMPKPQSELVGDSEYEPSSSEQRKWMRLHEVVNDPISALDHVRHGTLTQDHVNALQQVHPELLADMQQRVMEHMDPSKVRKLPGSTKIALGLFLGSPITQSMTPQAILANQSAFQMNSMPPQAPKSTVGGMKELNLAERTSTKTQRLESPE